jgi:DNA-directed RNA polymerase specialized sigma24 family protein
MTIKKYIESNYSELRNKVIAVTRNHQNSDDLLNDIILNLLEKNNDFTNQLIQDDKVQQYIIKSAYIQYNSSTSPFYTQYKKQKWNELDEEMHEDTIIELQEDKEKLGKDIKIYINNLPFYQKELATKHFVEGNSQREISKMYNINRLHISKDITTIKKNIHLSFSRDKYRTK